jgi:hypothetical protein
MSATGIKLAQLQILDAGAEEKTVHPIRALIRAPDEIPQGSSTPEDRRQGIISINTTIRFARCVLSWRGAWWRQHLGRENLNARSRDPVKGTGRLGLTKVTFGN